MSLSWSFRRELLACLKQLCFLTNIVANCLQLAIVEAKDLAWEGGVDGKGDKVLAFLPFFYIYGLRPRILYEICCLYHKS